MLKPSQSTLPGGHAYDRLHARASDKTALRELGAGVAVLSFVSSRSRPDLYLPCHLASGPGGGSCLVVVVVVVVILRPDPILVKRQETISVKGFTTSRTPRAKSPVSVRIIWAR